MSQENGLPESAKAASETTRPFGMQPLRMQLSATEYARFAREKAIWRMGVEGRSGPTP